MCVGKTCDTLTLTVSRLPSRAIDGNGRILAGNSQIQKREWGDSIGRPRSIDIIEFPPDLSVFAQICWVGVVAMGLWRPSGSHGIMKADGLTSHHVVGFVRAISIDHWYYRFFGRSCWSIGLWVTRPFLRKNYYRSQELLQYGCVSIRSGNCRMRWTVDEPPLNFLRTLPYPILCNKGAQFSLSRGAKGQ